MKLIKLNNGKLINLAVVSTISIDKNKVIYNFINSIDILGRETPDYSYERFKTNKEAEKRFKELQQLDIIKDRFLFHKNHKNEIVNKDYITSIVYDEKKQRIIFNLNYSISVIDKKTGKEVKISKFIYWNNIPKQEYEKIEKEFLSKYKA